MSESRPPIRHALQEALHMDEASEAQGNLITRWVVVAESMAPDGRRWLSRVSGDAADEGLSEWDARMLCTEGARDEGWND